MALKILLADDSMTAQNMGKKILLDAGYEVVAVSNGAAAIKRITSDRPDIIILDEYMPGYMGSEVCERVKNSPDTARTPVLLTVGKMEPFSPDKANKVRADGVLIKPFEATDLLAVVQNIAKKVASGASYESTAPVEPSVIPPSGADYQETVPIQAKPRADYEQTVRLSPEEVRAVQDQTYNEWVASADAHGHVQPAAPEMPVVAPAVEEPAAAAAEASLGLPMIEPADFADDASQPAMPIVPGLDSAEAPIARAMAGKLGNDFFTVTPPDLASESEEDGTAAASPAMFASAAESMVEAPPHPVFSIHPHEPETEIAPEMPAFEAASLDLETSAPLTPGPAFVAPMEGFEATIAAPEEPIVAEAAPDLEINSPIHQQPHVEVASDDALVTNEEDLSQFTTRFGQEGGEESHVGVASDLPPEQMAALVTPVVEEEAQDERSQLETADFVVPPSVELEVPAPVLPDAVFVGSDSETPATEVAEPETPVVAEASHVLEEVGTIASEAALAGTGPLVAYVPGIEDTQMIPGYVPPQVEAADTATGPVVISEPEPVIAATEPEPVAEPEPFAEAEPVTAVAEEQSLETGTSSLTPVMEAAAAAAAGGAFAAAAHFFSAPVYEEASIVLPPRVEETIAETPAETPFEPLAAETPVAETITEATAVEELSAATAGGQLEEHATAAADAALASAVEPAVTAAIESAGPEAHVIADEKLSEAVSRALEKLRPQLIEEIMKELFK